MLGRRSLRRPIIALNSEIERTIHKRNIQEPVQTMGEEEPPKTLKAYFAPTAYTSPSCIQLPENQNGNYEIRTNIISMLPVFLGKSNEDPYKHLDEFLELCTTFRIQTLNEEGIRLRLFPFSLKEKAKHWLQTLERNSITTWDQLQQQFLNKFFPMGRTTEFRRLITTFTQNEREEFHETWERFNELLRRCPHHQVPKWQLVQGFYDGLTDPHRQMIDASCAGTFMLKNEDEAWSLYENLSDNSVHHASSIRKRSHSMSDISNKGGIYEIKDSDHLSLKVEMISKQLDKLMSNQTTQVAAIHNSNNEYNMEMQDSEIEHEQIAAIQPFGRIIPELGNSYNPAWKNHPSLTWKQSDSSNQYSSNQHPQYQKYQQNQQPQYSQNIEERIIGLINKLEQYDQTLNSQGQSISKIESQLGQLAASLNRREEGKLPSQPITNPNSVFHVGIKGPIQTDSVQLITLRSGKFFEDTIAPQKDLVNPTSNNKSVARYLPLDEDIRRHIPPAPFPKCLNAPSPYSKKGTPLEDVIEVFKPVKINLPLLDDIKQVPSYDLCMQKRTNPQVSKTILLSENISSILMGHTTQKLKDPGTPTISCTIGDFVINRAILDLGASVNLLPYSVYKSLGLGELLPTSATLQFADQSVKIPRGMIENVLVKVDKFYFPVDFIVLDMEPVRNDHLQIPVILGRPFLATTNACINCRTGAMDVSFENMKVRLDIFQTRMQKESEDEVFHINLLEKIPHSALFTEKIDYLMIDKDMTKGIEDVQTDKRYVSIQSDYIPDQFEDSPPKPTPWRPPWNSKRLRESNTD